MKYKAIFQINRGEEQIACLDAADFSDAEDKLVEGLSVHFQCQADDIEYYNLISEEGNPGWVHQPVSWMPDKEPLVLGG